MRPLSSRDVLGRPVRWLQRGMGGAAIVLVYHRVADVESDPQLQAVPVDVFADQIALLAERFTPVPLETLIDCIDERGRIPKRAVAVTFDDGYADNFAAALPVLERHAVPATVFVNSATVDSERLGWVDEVERLVLRSPRLPSRIEVTDDDGGTSVWAIEPGGPDPADWDVTRPVATDRQRVYSHLCELLRTAPPARREELLASLRTQIGGDLLADEESRWLRSEEVASLAAGGLVAIGGHTAHHRHLASASGAEQRDEILADKHRLESITGRPVDLFSYPYGGTHDYGAETVEFVSQAGYRCACATHAGAVTPWSDRWRIPRRSAVRLRGEPFASAIEIWLAGGR